VRRFDTDSRVANAAHGVDRTEDKRQTVMKMVPSLSKQRRSIAVQSQVDIRAGKRAVVQRDEVHVYDVQ
jgi:hypothetical protein